MYNNPKAKDVKATPTSYQTDNAYEHIGLGKASYLTPTVTIIGVTSTPVPVVLNRASPHIPITDTDLLKVFAITTQGVPTDVPMIESAAEHFIHLNNFTLPSHHVRIFLGLYSLLQDFY